MASLIVIFLWHAYLTTFKSHLMVSKATQPTHTKMADQHLQGSEKYIVYYNQFMSIASNCLSFQKKNKN